MTVLAGSVTVNANDDFFSAGDFAASLYTTVAAGTPDQAQVFVRSGSTFTSLTGVIYANSSGNPGAKIGQFTATTSNTAGTKTVTGYTGSALTLSQSVWLAALPLGGSWNETGTNGTGGYKGISGQASVPDPFGSPNFDNAATADTLLPILIEQVGGAATNVNTPTFQAIPFMGGH